MTQFILVERPSPISYPDAAGYKEHTTSKDAALGIEASGKAARLRNMVLEWYRAGNTGTADECAHALGEEILSIRPRCAELHKSGFICQTGERRRADGGRSAHVWGVA
jgi:hypothetical protein